MKRIAEMQGGRNVVLKRWRKNAKQQWWTFNCVDKTIRNGNWKNYALEI
jgi:hypothetical protein